MFFSWDLRRRRKYTVGLLRSNFRDSGRWGD
jgi:hypothetical protein